MAGFDGKSALLGHELAYCLGQIKDPYALPTLTRVLRDNSQHVMVRHEAAEAIGAIGDKAGLDVLRPYVGHKERAISETAEIAVAKIEYDHSDQGRRERHDRDSIYMTIDPAPAAAAAASSSSPLVQGSSSSEQSIDDLEKTLLDERLPLFERYRAMFALRNLGTREAVLALAKGFGDSSALFRHEVAFVFGQLTSPHSVPALIDVVQDSNEDEMVRHEAAEALGSIADERCLPVLVELASRSDKDGVPRVVRESAEVALDMYEYEKSGSLHYAPPAPPTAASSSSTVQVA